MIIQISFNSIKDARWHEWLVRFVLGGLATVLTGAVAALCGSKFGGLFLAMPAVFCASATMIESHQKRRKREKGLEGKRRGQKAAALDAAGRALGSIALFAFAASLVALLPLNVYVAFAAGLLAWIMVAVTSWIIWRNARRMR